MNAADHYQAIVIGSGQGGTPLCVALAEAGLRTALVERAHVGGTCVNEGCTPTKTMVASGRVAYLARRGADYGVETGPVRVDLARVWGEARFVAPCTVALDGRNLAADQVFINVGCRPAAPDITGIDRVGALDSTSIMEL